MNLDANSHPHDDLPESLRRLVEREFRNHLQGEIDEDEIVRLTAATLPFEPRSWADCTEQVACDEFHNINPTIVGGVLCKTEEQKEIAEALLENPPKLPFHYNYAAPAMRGDDGTIIRKSGGEHFQAVLNHSIRGGKYYIYPTEIAALEQNKILVEGGHHIIFGGAEGEKSALMNQGGAAARVTALDISQHYLDALTELFVRKGIPRRVIRKILGNYSHPDFFTEVWDKQIETGDGVHKVVEALGKEWANDHVLRDRLRGLRPRLKPDIDVIYVGLDSTWHEQTLIDCYSDPDFPAFFKNGADFCLNGQLNLGFDLQKAVYRPSVETDYMGQCRTVNYDLYNLVRNSVCQPQNGIDEELAKALAKGQVLHQIKDIPLLRAGNGDSYPRDHLLQIFWEEGYKTVKRAEHSPGPLRVKNSSENPWVDNNVWEITPRII